MSGQDLAAKLRDLGFQVKSHMTALDEFKILEIQARLEAYGIVGEQASGQGVSTVGGLKIKRKKKAVPRGDEPEAPEGPEAPAEGEAEEEGAGEALEPAAAAPAAEPAVQAPEPARVAEPAAPTPVEAPAAERAASEPREVPEAPPAAADGEAAREAQATAPAEPEPEEELAAEWVEEPERPEPEAEAVETVEAPEIQGVPAAPEAHVAPAAQAAAGAVAGEEGADIVRPSARRRVGKVVGFIDPSQFQAQPAKRSESRRLRSSDDEVPDVRPTMGRDRASGMVRGDQTRGAMTAQQLREREAGRFLRRRRVQPGAGPVGRRIPDGAKDSPHFGGGVTIDSPITIKKLANTLAVKENEVLKLAFQQLGFGININSLLDDETAVLLAHEFGVELEVRQEIEAEAALLKELEEKRQEVGSEQLVQRPPTVAFLGHVDHGKTTLIDTIRRSRIAQGESGGITQHIGAYQVKTKAGHRLTILDTPGHAAFTAMRARGAQAVDVVVLVVAADDGVKPQTEEAYNHARAAQVPIVVALNKIDKPEANPDRVKNELAGLGLTPEEWGGETAMLEVSGLTGTGTEELLERVFLESEVLELTSHPSGPATGVVLEAEIQQGKGKVAHLLVQDGSLKRGDVILAGEGYGKVRSIHDDRGREMREAGPSMPVEVTGLNELPTIGDHFHVVDSLDRAQEVAGERARKMRQLSQIERRVVRSENILEAVAEQSRPSINLIVKADVQGSVEVLKHQLGELKHQEVEVKVVHAGVGAVQESDVDLAVTSDARILAFHTSAHNKVRQAAERQGVEIKVYEVIYELLDDVRRLMEGELAPQMTERVTGHVEIRRIFKSSKVGNIAGCYVLDGTISRNSQIRLLRNDQVILTGTLASLRREKDDVKEVREGFECGIVLRDYNDVQEGDIVESFEIHTVKRTL